MASLDSVQTSWGAIPGAARGIKDAFLGKEDTPPVRLLPQNAAYRLVAWDGVRGVPVAEADFPALPGQTSVEFAVAPESYLLSRPLRSDVSIDLAGGVTVLDGGSGIARIVIRGAHPIGRLADNPGISPGKAKRDEFMQFFRAWERQNSFREKRGLPAFLLCFEVVGGQWSEHSAERWLVWPDAYPEDARSSSNPLRWAYNLTLQGLRRLAPEEAELTQEEVDRPRFTAGEVVAVCAALDARLSALQKLLKGIARISAGLRKIQTLVRTVSRAVSETTAFTNETVYSITGPLRGILQETKTLEGQLRPSSLFGFIQGELRGVITDTRKMAGMARLLGAEWQRQASALDLRGHGLLPSAARMPLVVLTAGASLRTLAAEHLGDGSRWPELAKANGLEWPYVDTSGAGGAPGARWAGRRVVGAGATLRIPVPGVDASVGPVTAGRDPVGAGLEDVPAVANTYISGEANLRARLLRRLLTPRGTIPWRPSYGSNLRALAVGQAMSLEVGERLRVDAASALAQDECVLQVVDVAVVAQDSGWALSASLLVTGGSLNLSSRL